MIQKAAKILSVMQTWQGRWSRGASAPTCKS